MSEALVIAARIASYFASGVLMYLGAQFAVAAGMLEAQGKPKRFEYNVSVCLSISLFIMALVCFSFGD